MAEPFVHYLISITTRQEPIDQSVLMESFGPALNSIGVVPEVAFIYSSHYPVRPNTVELRDVWNNMTDEQRTAIKDINPILGFSLTMLTGDIT